MELRKIMNYSIKCAVSPCIFHDYMSSVPSKPFFTLLPKNIHVHIIHVSVEEEKRNPAAPTSTCKMDVLNNSKSD